MLGREDGTEAGKTAGLYPEGSRKLLGFAAREWHDLPLGKTSPTAVWRMDCTGQE